MSLPVQMSGTAEKVQVSSEYFTKGNDNMDCGIARHCKEREEKDTALLLPSNLLALKECDPDYKSGQSD